MTAVEKMVDRVHLRALRRYTYSPHRTVQAMAHLSLVLIRYASILRAERDKARATTESMAEALRVVCRRFAVVHHESQERIRDIGRELAQARKEVKAMEAEAQKILAERHCIPDTESGTRVMARVRGAQGASERILDALKKARGE